MLNRGAAASTAKPSIGGWFPSIRLTEQQTAVLNAVADQLVPGGDGFPAPSQTGVVSFIAQYVAPEGRDPRWFPFIGAKDFRRRIDDLGEKFVHSTPEQQVEILERLEQDSPEFFAPLRDLVFYAYYSQPEVVRSINRVLEAGKDYRGRPQPYGYSDVIDDWDESLFDHVSGSYTRTEDVKPLDIPEDLFTTSTRHDGDDSSR